VLSIATASRITRWFVKKPHEPVRIGSGSGGYGAAIERSRTSFASVKTIAATKGAGVNPAVASRRYESNAAKLTA
jgi:hypothetical protein